MTDIEQKAEYTAAYNKGKEDGEYLAKRRIAIELTNVYYNNGPYGWFYWRLHARLKAYLDYLWANYGPSYDED